MLILFTERCRRTHPVMVFERSREMATPLHEENETSGEIPLGEGSPKAGVGKT